jgi:hypothetical protein
MNICHTGPKQLHYETLGNSRDQLNLIIVRTENCTRIDREIKKDSIRMAPKNFHSKYADFPFISLHKKIGIAFIGPYTKW